jgi:hypothetical protein
MDLFLLMKWENVKPNQFTFVSVLNYLDVMVVNVIVTMYVKCESLEEHKCEDLSLKTCNCYSTSCRWGKA